MNKSLLKLLPILSVLLVCSCSPAKPSSSEMPSSEESSETSSASQESSEQSSEEISSEESSIEQSSEEESSEETSSEPESSEPEIDPYDRPELFLMDNPYVDQKEILTDFDATLFDNDSLSLDTSVTLGDGVVHNTYSFNLNNGRKVIANTIDVDLTKADIRTNYNSAKSTVYNQIESFENEENIEVLAGINADFFGGTRCVNAYVKDGKIIKDAHNDNGKYNYKDLSADIPASMPMLLGATGTSARIAPVVEGEDVETTIKSKFYIKMVYAGEDKVVKTMDVEPYSILNTYNNKVYGDYTILYDESTTLISPTRNDIVYKIKLHDDHQHVYKSGIVEERKVCTNSKIYTSDIADGYVYVYIKNGCEEYLTVGDHFAFTVGSNDSHWDGYQNIIGGRQSLVENGEIAPTVTLENSNGAQTTNIPRSAVGITDDNHVVLVGIESLRYNKKNTVSETDSYGVNLPELAEFMRKIGCWDAMNLDGGGSTQLITSSIESPDEHNLVVRSSDYASYNLNSCRGVYNSILVTPKQ